MQIEPGVVRRHEVHQPVHGVPPADEAGEAENQPGWQRQCRLGCVGIKDSAEASRIDAVRDDADTRQRHAIFGHCAGQHAGHRQDMVGPVPHGALRPTAEPSQFQPVVLHPLLIQGRIHFQQQRQAGPAAHPDAGKQEQAEAFIDDIRTVGAHRRAQAQERRRTVGDLQQFVERPG